MGVPGKIPRWKAWNGKCFPIHIGLDKREKHADEDGNSSYQENQADHKNARTTKPNYFLSFI
jgi:hypothetical protein